MKKNIYLSFFGFSTKKIFYSDDARKRLLKGINLVCKTTQITLGPKVFLHKFLIQVKFRGEMLL